MEKILVNQSMEYHVKVADEFENTLAEVTGTACFTWKSITI